MKRFDLRDPLFLPHCGCQLQLILNTREILVLIGENGIGKSTLLHRCSSLLPREARVVVEQKALEYFYDRKLGRLKELFISTHPPGLNLPRLHWLWGKFKLNQKEDRLLSHLSGGEAQSLKLCLALAKDVEFYFLDEPSQFLDLERKAVLLEALLQLKEESKYLLIIEHNRDWLTSGIRVQELLLQEQTLMTGGQWTI